MSTILQTELPLSAVKDRRPMRKVDGALGIIGAEPWQLEGLLDEGKIRGVLDIASPSAGRRELRFLAVACEEHKRGLVVERTNLELCIAIFGQPQAFVRAHWIKSRLICHPTHFYDLVRERVIRLAKGSEQRTGPGGSAVVDWAELLRLVKERRRA